MNKRIFRAHVGRGAIARYLDKLLVEPDVPARIPVYLTAGMAHDEDFLAALGAACEGVVGVLLQWDLATTANAFVRRDDEGSSCSLRYDRQDYPARKPPKTTEWMAPMRAQASMA